MERFRVTFEMINGESHFYEIENESLGSIYTLINTCNDGWIEIPHNGETHFIKADKLTRVKIISQADYERAQKEIAEHAIQAMNSFNF